MKHLNVPAPPFAVFDEFGVPADDRVQDYAASACADASGDCCETLRGEGRSEGAYDIAELVLPALEEATRVLSDLPACAIEGTRVRRAWESATHAISKVKGYA